MQPKRAGSAPLVGVPGTSLLATLGFAVMFYVLPLQALLRSAYKPLLLVLPTLGMMGLPDPLLVYINVGLLCLLLGLYLLMYGVLRLAFWLLRVYHYDELLRRLGVLTSIKDLRGLDHLLLRLLPMLFVACVVALPFVGTEHLMVLIVVIWLALAANALSQPGHIQPFPVPQPVEPLPDRDPDDGDVHKVFTWQFPERVAKRRGMLARTFTVELSISRRRYEEYHKRRRLAPRQWDEYVREDTPETLVLAGRLLALGRAHLYRAYDQACNTLAFVQHCIAYAADVSPVNGQPMEYPKYPIEALCDEQGDCEDHAILAAALLKRMGYEVALILLPEHVAMGVAGAEGLPGAFIPDPKTGKRYFYGETTGGGWLLGELPQHLQPLVASGQVELLPVNPPSFLPGAEAPG